MCCHMLNADVEVIMLSRNLAISLCENNGSFFESEGMCEAIANSTN